MSSEELMRWATAGGISLGLHVLLLVVVVSCGGSGKTELAPPAPEEVSVTSSQSPIERQPETKADPEEQQESKPVVSQSPVRTETKSRPSLKPETKPEPKPVAPAVKPETKASSKTGSLPDVPASTTYIVKKGDSLTHLAQDFGCTLQDLAKLNNTTVKKLGGLKVGQRIKVPKKN